MVASGGMATAGGAPGNGGAIAKAGASGTGGAINSSGGASPDGSIATGGVAAAGAGGSSSGDGATGGLRTGGATGSGGSTAIDVPIAKGGTSGTGGGGGSPNGGATSIACPAGAATGTPTTVSIDGANIKAANINGLTFKGFGVLSANGTSALLMDYKSQHPDKYAELLNVLFGGSHPLMTQVKIEMGNDRNNSTGPDPATMRLSTEVANVKRAPGFQLAADAKTFNPSLKVSILRWNAPGWVKTNDDVYTWYKNTILAAYRSYGYMIDFVNPGVNESAPDLTWTTQYAARIKADAAGFNSTTEQALYNGIKVVISDEVGIGSFGATMISDSTLRSSVSVAGYHYNTDDDSAGDFTKLAEQFDKEIWNSEAQATFSNTAFRPISGSGIGGTNSPLEMGNTIIKGFVNSHRTHFIYQPAIGSFYEGGQYSSKELLSARDPWSGWIHYDAGLVILRHFAWFATAGWENQANTLGVWRVVAQSSYTGATGTNPVSGRNGTPSYMTLAAPDKRNFSTIFMNDSATAQTYKLQATNMAYTGKPPLELWETRAAESGKAFNSNYMQYLCDVSADASGTYIVSVKPWSVLTATTLVNVGIAEYNTPLPIEGGRTVLDTDATGANQSTSDKVLYADDFEYSGTTVPVFGVGGRITGSEDFLTSRGGLQGAIPRYTCDRNGGFEVYLPSGSTNHVLRQQVDQSAMGLGGTWNSGNPITGVGDRRWLNYKASVDVSFENNSTQSGNNYAAIGARQQGGANSHTTSGTPYLLRLLFDGTWALLVDGASVAGGNVVSGTGGATIAGFKATYDTWHNLGLAVVDSKVTAYLDGTALTTYTDASPRLSGRVDLASGYYYTRFDNLKVETVDGSAPYYSEFLDDQETTDLASPPVTKLVYGGTWSHANGQDMYDYQRTLSKSSTAGASLKYTFTGTGLDILGPNDGSAKLEVTVDGQVTNASASTLASKEGYQTFTLRGLSNASHTVQVKVLGGTLVVDGVATVAAPIQ